jgi:hypothetical protein
MRSKAPLAAAFAAAVAIASPSAWALTSFVEGFESPSIGSDPYQTFGSGSSFNGWSVSGHSVDIVSNNWQPTISAYQGTQFVDLAGDLPGAISRQLQLDAGLYQLSFAYRGNTFDGAPAGDTYMAIVISGVGPEVPLLVSAPASQHGWLTTTIDFTATEPVTLLSFSSLIAGQTGNGGMLIDAVQITPVPEAHEWAMMLAGLGVIGTVAGRRRRLASA